MDLVVTLALVDSIEHLKRPHRTLERCIREALELHPHAHIFTSLPDAGIVRAATMLAEIGGARGRFPTDDSRAALAGGAPPAGPGSSTPARSSSLCDKKLRDALINFADDS